MADGDPEFVAKGAAAAVGVVLTIAQAVPVLDKRLARVADIERELGTLGGLVGTLYVRPQKLLRVLLFLLTAVGVAAVFAFAIPGLSFPLADFLRAQGLIIILVWFVLGMAAYTNFFSKLGLYVMRGVSLLTPLRALLLGGRRAEDGPGWTALNALINYNEGAKPMIVDRSAARTLADTLLQLACANPAAGEENRAAPPEPLPADEDMRDRLGNALLVGCVIEGAHSRPHGGGVRRKWRPFYAAVQQLALQTDSPFAPARIRAPGQLPALAASIVDDLNALLAGDRPPAAGKAGGLIEGIKGYFGLETRIGGVQPPIPNSGVLLADLQSCLAHLNRHYEGRATRIDPGWSGPLRSQGERIRGRVEDIPGLGPGMRAQFVKLAFLWGIWPGLSIAEFKSAGAARIAALLLNRGVIVTMAETRTFNLSQPDGQQLYRVAMAAVVEEAIALVDAQPAAYAAWLPAAASRGTPAIRQWMTAYEVDYRLFDYAKRLAEGAVPGETMAPWAVVEGHIVRT